MPLIHFVLPDGSRRSVDGRAGTRVMETAIRHDVRGIDAECGGALSCATCHVYVVAPAPPGLAPPDADEIEMLQFVAAERLPTSRLSCQIEVTAALDGLVVRVPSAQR